MRTLMVVAAVIFFVTAEASASNFNWCVATSAYQIEGGGNNSDWWSWEQASGLESSGRAADHWSRWREDIEWLKTLGVDSYRFSLEWAKVEPQEGVLDQSVLDHYRQLLLELRRAGIRPMVTLLHFTLPMWLAERGGLEAEDFPQAFQKYTEVVSGELGDLVEYWITFNEPMVQVGAGYIEGVFPPGYKRSVQGMAAPLTNILKAHALAYHTLHAKGEGETKVGMSYHLRWFQAKSSWNLLDLIAANLVSQVWNWTLSSAVQTGHLSARIVGLLRMNEHIEGLQGTQDFFGLNYYSRDLVSFSFATGLERSMGGGPVSDLNWEIYPEGLYKLLKEVGQRFPGLPIYITENGLADQSDSLRSQFITDHVKAVERARGEGVPVHGYCHWSLLDNFEWAEGFGPRFGLLEVDYQSYERRPRPSFWHYARQIKAHKIPQIEP